eukprot:8617064-Alexandrium_andersonii.AAC.1
MAGFTSRLLGARCPPPDPPPPKSASGAPANLIRRQHRIQHAKRRNRHYVPGSAQFKLRTPEAILH